MTMLEETIAAISREGFWINNLFQHQANLGGQLCTIWRANLSKVLPVGTKLWEFGEGSSPSEALQAALVKAKLEEGTLSLPKTKPTNFHKNRLLDPAFVQLSLSDFGL